MYCEKDLTGRIYDLKISQLRDFFLKKGVRRQTVTSKRVHNPPEIEVAPTACN